jgi:CheY-like chemotaxis protein
MVLAVVRTMLERLGFGVIAVPDGDQAMEIFERRPDGFALVLLDLTMPGMSSEESCRQIRALNGDVPIVLSSGYSEQELAARFAGNDVSGFVQKPYRLDALAETLRVALKPHPI